MADITSIFKTGSAAGRVDVTFVAEGYLASERATFLADAARFADYIFSPANAALNAPFSNYKNYFNANALFVASNQSRWNVTSGAADTYFQASSYLSDGRLVYGDSSKVATLVNTALPSNEHDITIVLIHSQAYGGAGGSIAWATTGNLDSAEVLLHELGHSVAGLADEYVDPALANLSRTAPVNTPNVTSEKNAPPWQAWLGYQDGLGTVGLYEGGMYSATGMWRATLNSKMLSLGYAFSVPEKEAFALAYYGKIGDYLSLDIRIPGLCLAIAPDRASLAYTWRQKGVALTDADGWCYDLYGAGRYTLDNIITLTTEDATGVIRTGLSQTRQSESVTVQGGAQEISGATASITQGGKLFHFDSSDNTITVRDSVSAAYFDGGLGSDTVVLSVTQASVSLQKLATGTWLLSNASAPATPLMALRNVEYLQFSDTTQTLLDTSTGSSANDRLVNRAASELINGAGGLDTLVYTGARAAFDISRSGAGFTITDKASGSEDVLSNVERLLFNDAAFALDIDGIGGQAYRLYQAAFNRTPDNGGLGFWIHAMDLGASLHDVANAFVVSEEFKTAYGASPTNAQIVAQLYLNVLHRAGEAGGAAFWQEALDTGRASRADVLASFSESAENQAGLASVIGQGFAYLPYGAS